LRRPRRRQSIARSPAAMNPDPAPNLFEKQEVRRRSAWGRLWQRRWLFAFVIVTGVVLLAAAAYLGARKAGYLPGQIAARRSLAAMQELVKTRQFTTYVVGPIRQHLTVNLAAGRKPAELADAIHRATDYEKTDDAVLPPMKTTASPMINGWRDIIAELRQRNADVYRMNKAQLHTQQQFRGYVILRVLKVAELSRADTEAKIQQATRAKNVQIAPGLPMESAATYIDGLKAEQTRLETLRRQVYAGDDPYLFARNVAAIDQAVDAAIAQIGLSPAEFYAILFTANTAQAMNQPKPAQVRSEKDE